MLNFRSIALVAVVLLTAFLGPFGGNAVIPMFSVLKNVFNVDIFYLGLSITLYMIPFSIVQLFSGALSDMVYGRRKILILGFLVYSLGSLAAVFSSTIWLFVSSRMIQGVGSALSLPVSMAIIGDLFRREIRGRIMGGVSIAITLGAALGPLVGGYLAVIDWRLTFIILSVIPLALALLVYMVLVEGKTTAKLSSKALNILKVNLLDPNVLAIGCLGFVLLFIRISIYTYVSEVLSLKPYSLREDVIGGYLSLAGFGGLVSGFIAGYLTDWIGRRKTTVLGLTLILLSMILYLTPYWYSILILTMFLVGFSNIMSFTPINTMAIEINPKFRATVTSIYGSLRFLGYAFGPIAAYPVYLIYSLPGVIFLNMFLLVLSIFVFYLVKVGK